MDASTMASINLNAVLRTLGHLPGVDPSARDVAECDMTTVRFTAPGLATARVVVGGGQVTWHEGAGPADIGLLFPRTSMVNAMFAGTGNPVPTKGFRRISWLKGPFTQLTDRLAYYLRPTPELLTDPLYTRANTVLTLHLAAYAMAEIGTHDTTGRAIASAMPDGDVTLAVRGGPVVHLRCRAGRLRTLDGPSQTSRAHLIFEDLDTAGQVLRGELASFTAVGRGSIELGGFVPLLDKTNKLLGLVPRYLS
ncbi:MAG: hypothetical protein Q4G43_03500 [Mobilicoccus sp.]|nr:hypothetical protein [Mobilicoccus sp.]